MGIAKTDKICTMKAINQLSIKTRLTFLLYSNAFSSIKLWA